MKKFTLILALSVSVIGTAPNIVLVEDKSDLIASENLYYAIKDDNNYFDLDNRGILYEASSHGGSIGPGGGEIVEVPKPYIYNYYKHLNLNKPANTMGICGYTAISMFLSYYDSYYSDLFIEEKYDASVNVESHVFDMIEDVKAYQSPGVIDTIKGFPKIESMESEIELSGITDKNSSAYKEALDQKIMTWVYEQIDSGSFLGYLFEIALSKNIIKPHFSEDFSHVINDTYVRDLGMNYEGIDTILKTYIELNNNLNGNVSIITGQATNSDKNENLRISENSRIRSEVINIVKSGNPVIMGGNHRESNGNITGHDVVAYYYDSTNDILYGNLGWGSDDTCANLDEYFNYKMADYWSISITSNLLRERTNNYIFTDKDAYYSPSFGCLFNTIAPSDYGYAQAYNDSELTKEITLKDTAEVFSTKRLRCGYIEKEAINLSTRGKKSEGLSYLEFTFNKPIELIEIELSWWSDDERVSSTDSTYIFEYYSETGFYFTRFDFWSDISLNADRNKPNFITPNISEEFYSFRFYATSSNPINDRNKGRLSLFDITIVYAQ